MQAPVAGYFDNTLEGPTTKKTPYYFYAERTFGMFGYTGAGLSKYVLIHGR